MNIFSKSVIALLFLTGCDTTISNFAVPRAPNPLDHAVEKIGLEERKDRQELKSFVGVDPVRTEWCAAFVNAVLDESDIPSNNNHEYPLTARAFLDWGEPISKENIYPGDIVIFPRGNQGWQGHVGFYISTVTINEIEFYQILGGNQSNKVSIELYRVSSVLGIRRYSFYN